MTDLNDMDKLQAKLVKATLGLSKFSRTTPLLKALNISKVINLKDVYSLDLFKSIMFSRSRAAVFYSHIMNTKQFKGKFNNIVTRSLHVCNENSISIVKYLFNDQYYSCERKALKTVYKPGSDGLVDSIRMLLRDFSVNDRNLLKLLLSPF